MTTIQGNMWPSGQNLVNDEPQDNSHNKGHFILGAGLRTGPNSQNLNQKDRLISSNRVQGLYTRGRPEHSPIPCGVLGDTILAPNHMALDEISGRAFPRPELSSRTGWGSSVGLFQSSPSINRRGKNLGNC